MKCFFLFCFSIFFVSTTIHAQSTVELKADSLSGLAAYKAAIPLYKQALNTTTNQTSLLRISTNLAICYQRSRQDKASIPVLEKAIQASEGQRVPDSLVALAYHKLAVGFYKAENDDAAAIKYWKKALGIREQLFDENHLSIIKGNHNIGTSLYYLNRLEESNFFLKKSLDLHLSRAEKDTVLLTDTYLDLSKIALAQEDIEKAENYIKVSKPIFEKIYKDEPWNLTPLYERYFILKQRQNDIEGMNYYANRVLEIYEGFEDLYDDDKWKIANAHNNLALAYDLAEEKEKSISHYLKSIAINEQFPEKRQADLVIGLSNLAQVYQDMGKLDAAASLFENSISLSEKNKKLRKLAIDKNSFAEVLALQGKNDLALTTNQEAITLGEKITVEKPLLVGFLHGRILILKKIYDSTKEEDYLQEAIKIVTKMLPLFDEIRQGYQSDESKSFLSKKSKTVLNTAISLHVQAYLLNKEDSYLYQAFALAERAKSLILLDALNEAEAKQSTNVPSELLQRENKLKKELAALQKQIHEAATELTTIQKDIVNINWQLEKLGDTLEQNYAAYFDAKYSKKPFDIHAFQQKIEGTLIEYFTTEDKIYAFVLTKQSIELVEINNDFDLVKSIQTLRSNIYGGFLNTSRSDKEHKSLADSLVAVSHLLYQKLIQPIEQKTALNEKLLLIPDGILGYIPFEVLLSEKPKESLFFGSHPYLLKKYQISYCYSAALLEEMKTRKNTNTKAHFIAFAPSFDTDPTAALADVLTPLDYNIPEVEALQDLMGGTIFTAKEATEDVFNQKAPNSQIIHLATHGKADDKVGDYAFLAFTAIKDSIENEYLYNRDLYNLQLNADMVVLSACETGIGELQKGEGIISLARGFSYAGAKSIITTLWSINDAKTKNIMLDFYAQLKAGNNKDAALRQAKLNFIAENSHNAHPFFWAAFIPIGDMEAIDIGTALPWSLYGILGLGILGLFLWIWRKKG